MWVIIFILPALQRAEKVSFPFFKNFFPGMFLTTIEIAPLLFTHCCPACIISLNIFVATLVHLLCLQDVRQHNRSPNSLESVSSSTDSAYSEAASSPASSSGDERLLDDVDEEYSSGKVAFYNFHWSSFAHLLLKLESCNADLYFYIEVSVWICLAFRSAVV